MSTLVSISTTVKQGTGDDATHTTIIAATFSSSFTSFVMPCKLIASLSDDAYADALASRIISGEAIDLDSLMRADSAIAINSEYIAARYREYGESVVRVADDGRMYLRRTSPAAFIRRYIVPAIESRLTAEVVAFIGLDTEGMTPEHVAHLVKSSATTEVEAKVTHYTKGTSNADKAAHQSRKLSRAERKRRAREAAAK